MEVGSVITERLYGLFVQSEGVQTDSRKVRPGELFFALRGDNFDGNRYAASALESGALAAVVSDPQVATDDRYIVVPDTLVALQQLAHHHRKQFDIPLLAITGTNGKTTTKELTAAVISRGFDLLYTQGNLNNHIGVPLTLLSLRPNHNFAIIEMGASACGEIALLTRIAAPTCGLITNIGRAHLEGFGGVEGIRRGKGELYDYLAQNGGLAFVRGDDAVLAEMAAERPSLKCYFYGTSAADGVESKLVGEYNRFNIAAAVTIGRYFGISERDRAGAIADYEPSNNRSQQTITQYNRLTVDCYNANPSSMAAAIANFATLHDEECGQKVMILGDMLELGEWSAAEHKNVVDQALATDAQKIYLVGANFGQTPQRDSRITHSPDTAHLSTLLEAHPLRHALVLVKGSRGIGLERLLPLL